MDIESHEHRLVEIGAKMYIESGLQDTKKNASLFLRAHLHTHGFLTHCTSLIEIY